MIQADTERTTLPTIITTPRPVLNVFDGEPMADSRDIALRFGKRHDHVLRGIDNLLASGEDLRPARFVEATYEIEVLPNSGEQGRGHIRTHRCIRMNETAFALVVMGFTGPKALRWKVAYSGAFKAMADEIRRRQAPAIDLDDNAVLRRLLLGRIERIEALEAKVEETVHALAIASQVIEQDAPKIEAYETLMHDRGECNLANACRLIGAEQKPFFRWLRDGNYVFDQGDSTLPNAEYRKAGQFRVRLVDLGYGRYREQTLVTRQGLVWLRHRWQAHLLRKAKEAAAARIQGELGI